MTRSFNWKPFVAGAGVCAVLAGAGLTATLTGAAPKFYNDDPLWSEPNTQDAAKVEPWDIDLVIDLTYNQFGKPGDPTPNVRAKNVNSIDEVPDGAWFTNRAGYRELTTEEITTGPDTTAGPAAGKWTITSSKSDGISPGFTIKDANGQRWFLKFDPPGYRGMATGTEVTITKLFWALGYYVPENHISTLRIDRLEIGKGATFTPPGRKKRAMELSDVETLLKQVEHDADGSYRIIASKALEGKPLGGFRFYGTRPDDPNDVVPHEHRRELRGYGVFAAWFNHVDAKAINSLDTLVKESDGRSIVRHHLLDFGSTMGSGGVAARERWEGYEYLVQPKDVGKQMVSFGFAIPEWRKVDVYQSPAIGSLPRDNTKWHPELWKPRVPNAAFLRARADDRFWAAQKAAALTDDLLRAAVDAGQFGNEEAEAFMLKALRERRDSIVRTFLPAINPVTQVELSDAGVLTFHNAAVDAGVAKAPAEYRVTVSVFDNATGETRQSVSGGVVGGKTSGGEPTGAPTRLSSVIPPLPSAPGTYLKVQISAAGAGVNPAWERPVDAYFHRTSRGWTLVGFERMPESGAAGGSGSGKAAPTL